MRILISPAKKMREDTDTFLPEGLPAFLPQTEHLKAALEANTTGDTTYTVQKGDTFNAIAYANDMSLSDLMALNPQADINRLMIGDVVNVKEVIPTVSVETVEEVTYHEAIACPVETQEDSSMYKGDSKILVQGEEGEALVEATVTYVNGVEKERDIQSSTTLREPTTTTLFTGGVTTSVDKMVRDCSTPSTSVTSAVTFCCPLTPSLRTCS